MDKSISRRSESLKVTESLLKDTLQRREELSKELAEVDNHRQDLKATIEILEHQAQGLSQVLERANAPQVEAVDYDYPRANHGALNGAKAERWLTGQG